MNTESIKDLLGNLDPLTLLEEILPDLNPLLDESAGLARMLMMAGPFVILAMGLYYFLSAPKEANYRSGYRCYFGMGSVEAWRYTQKLAGSLWSLLGLGLAVWMAIAGANMAGMDTMDAMMKMAGYILWQAAALLVCRVLINFLVFLRYDRKGIRRYTWAELWRG